MTEKGLSENTSEVKVIIAGAGIAGLSVAIALQRLPFLHIELYEQAPELKEIGASIGLTPNVLSTYAIRPRREGLLTGEPTCRDSARWKNWAF